MCSPEKKKQVPLQREVARKSTLSATMRDRRQREQGRKPNPNARKLPVFLFLSSSGDREDAHRRRASVQQLHSFHNNKCDDGRSWGQCVCTPEDRQLSGTRMHDGIPGQKERKETRKEDGVERESKGSRTHAHVKRREEEDECILKNAGRDSFQEKHRWWEGAQPVGFEGGEGGRRKMLPIHLCRHSAGPISCLPTMPEG